MNERANIRQSAVSGLFYPDNPSTLRDVVLALLKDAHPEKPDGQIRGLIVPHAGYRYSGLTAAYAYRLVSGLRFDTVVLIGPSHSEYFDAVSVFPGEAYETPLGRVSINRELRDRFLRESDRIILSDRGHKTEHAIEVQLPFLQETVTELTIVPLVLGDQDHELCLELGRAAARAVGNREILIIASTDLSHYHPAETARQLDAVTVGHIKELAYEELARDLELGRTEACGGGPVVALLSAMETLGVRNIRILHQCHSGDVTGDNESVVGYCSAVAYA